MFALFNNIAKDSDNKDVDSVRSRNQIHLFSWCTVHNIDYSLKHCMSAWVHECMYITHQLGPRYEGQLMSDGGV